MMERSANILESIVREYIKTGNPVSSGILFKKYDFGIRPAMIRAEMAVLTEDGYLTQPYHSAGRIPTDKGYEFFAQQVLERENYKNSRTSKKAVTLFEKGAWREFLDVFSEDLGLLSVAENMQDGTIYKEGLKDLVSKLSWDSQEAIMSVIRDFETIDERLRGAKELVDEEDYLEIFIGEKSPVTRSSELSVVAADYDVCGTRICLLLIGPKRMNYEGTAGALKELKKKTNI